MDGYDVTTPIWGFDGAVPGPVLRLRRAETLDLRLVNGLTQSTSVHWHGIRNVNAMDGVPGLTQEPVPEGESFDYAFATPDAGTYWYHSHYNSVDQLTRGLYGALIVEEDEPPAARDIPLILDDWLLQEDGSFVEHQFTSMHPRTHGGGMGNWATLNGDPNLKINVPPGEALRLRLINAANARVFPVGIGDVDATVIALDGQPCTHHQVPEEGLRIGPGQRADLWVRFEGDVGDERNLLFRHREGDVVLGSFVLAGEPVTDTSDAPKLPDNPLQKKLGMAEAVELPIRMEGGAMGQMREAVYKGQKVDIRTLVREHGLAWSFNGVAGLPERPLGRVARGRTVSMPFINDTRWPHTMHVHGHHFQLLQKNGAPINDGPWRDTVIVDPGDRIDVAFVADNPGKWLIHCHMAEHMAAGMETWFEVV